MKTICKHWTDVKHLLFLVDLEKNKTQFVNIEYTGRFRHEKSVCKKKIECTSWFRNENPVCKHWTYHYTCI